MAYRLNVNWLAGAAGLMVLALFAFPVQAQQRNGIAEPPSGETLAGVVVVRGSAEHPDFLRYELAFRRQGAPGDDWIVFAEGSQPVGDGTLAVWDTTVGRDSGAPVFPDGVYELRLRVVRSDYNYDEYFVSGLILRNADATPTATPSTPTPVVVTAEAQPDATFGAIEPLPSLTPFPTPTPLPTPPRAPLPVIGSDNTDTDTAGILDQLNSLESNRFVRAFGLGITLVLLAFGLLAFYLIVRAIWRRLWRLWWQK